MSRVRQQGLALVTVLLVMALLTLLVAGMLRSQQLVVAGVGQQIAFSRLSQLALAGEALMQQQLARQVSEVLQRSHSNQDWAKPQKMELADGALWMRMDDLTARLNLAALVGRTSLEPTLLARWEKLCASLDIAPPDLEPLIGQRLLDVSQLRALRGMDTATFERLRPWVVALPVEAGLNVNTAPSRLLSSLEGVAPSVARQVADARPEQGHASVQQFLASPEMSGLGTQARGLGVSSRWFRLELQAEWQEQRLYLYSDLEIDARTNRVHVVGRTFSAMREQTRNE